MPRGDLSIRTGAPPPVSLVPNKDPAKPGGAFFLTGATRLKQLLQPVNERHERNKNGADPISLAKSNNTMRRARRPMLAIRFQEDDLLSVLNGSASIPICNVLLDRHQRLSSLVRPYGTIHSPPRWFGKNCAEAQTRRSFVYSLNRSGFRRMIVFGRCSNGERGSAVTPQVLFMQLAMKL